MPRLADMRRAEMPQATAANHATNRDSTTPRDRCDGSGPVGENAPLSPGQGTWIAFLIPLRWRFWSVGADSLRIGPQGGPTPTAARRSARPPKKKQAGVPILDYELGSLVKICHSQTINSCCRVVTECDNDVSQLQPAAFSLDEPALALSTTPSCPRGPSSRQAITARRGSPRHPSPRAKTRAGDRRRARSTCVRRVGP